MNLEITMIPVSQIVLPEHSLKEHPHRQVCQIANSIRKFGFNDPVAVDENNRIIEGAGRVLAAIELEMETIPAIRLDHLDDAQVKAYRIAHNKICLNSEFNLDALRQEFEELTRLDESLLDAIGFEMVEIEDLLAVPSLAELSDELTESLKEAPAVICPHCGGQVYV